MILVGFDVPSSQGMYDTVPSIEDSVILETKNERDCITSKCQSANPALNTKCWLSEQVTLESISS